ncbi:MAG: molybdopterin-dependent oxidoreductase [Gammaproteobacteria bacterium]|nr:molybdopterin-dependent oxidoreductase [Gammaproteobacteria bacterium]NIR85063.1 molybdopterin-dependent oxidoreductase [Gammaproteobacteria bacterium]NIR88330.1 molybdopterin-dependent oxidoreductase [Gammaproteobacteria bacterium]NIU06110.1 molybdopterin-dependent oxidoreductase [Gammaproteobacteria bacterium]NIV73529.1 molybdopterin-dependent oxidoreductase [Gammaproteobacteria bacterium]
MGEQQATTPVVGRPLERLEDPALLTGRGRFADDLAVKAATRHAAVLRSPHAHARLVRVDVDEALALDGVDAVLTGEDVRARSTPFIVSVRQPMEHWAVAVDRVRHVGEPVAVVVARDRYRAEDALERIQVEYEPLSVVVDPEVAAQEDAPLLHPAVGSNVVSDRTFRYGDPEGAFASAFRRVGLKVRYPRSSCTPIECGVIVAEYDPAEDAYDVLANFQGPFTLHPVMARALGVPGTRLRLRTPADSGGSFGVKQALFPYIVGMCLAARKAGCPVKWVEDRLENLTATTSSTNRVTEIYAAVSEAGDVLALRFDQLEDCGAYLRAPEPATLYRMHGTLTGPYRVQHLEVRNRVVLTNKTPTGLNRGFGGPQLYFALERLMQRVARELGLEPLGVIRRNLIPAGSFPYRAPAGSLLDSGDYPAAVGRAMEEGGLAELETRRERARREGRLYGIGYAAVVEPSISNMGYITTVLTPEERHRAGPKGGGAAVATLSIDPVGAVAVSIDSTPQGQGHRTAIAQVVGEVLGLAPEEIAVNVEHDTLKDPWSIASGNYSSRFSGAVAGAAHRAAVRVRARLARMASAQLNVAPEQLGFADGRIYALGNPENSVPLRRVAGAAHWSPGSLPEGVEPGVRETEFWSMPELEPPDDADRVNSSGAYGFIFDYCGLEVDADTGQVRIDRYVTMHDPGRILNPALVDGQVRGGFAHALGAALYESLAYGEDGSFASGSFADYLVPTANEVPDPIILHMESPSPFTPLGAKGVGEGNCMSTPVCIANAVADALDVGDVELPLTPARVAALIHGAERAPSGRVKTAAAEPAAAEGGLTGEGAATVPATPEEVWGVLLDPAALAAVVPGCRHLEAVGDHRYRGQLDLGVGPVRGRFTAEVRYSDLDEPRSLTLSGSSESALGSSAASGRIELVPVDGGTRVRYRYRAEVGGKLAAVGGRMLQGVARKLIGQFFERLAAQAGGEPAPRPRGWWRRLLAWLGIRR